MSISERIVERAIEKTRALTGSNENAVLDVLASTPFSAYDFGSQCWRIAEQNREWLREGRVYEEAAALFSKEVGKEIPATHMEAFMVAMVDVTAVGRSVWEINEKYRGA